MKTFLILIAFNFLSFASFSQVNLNLGLRAYYPFTGNANDVSGNLNHPVFNNATLTSDISGNPNSAYRFNGTNTYMRILNSPSLNMSNQISIALKVKPLGFYTGPCYNNMMIMKGDEDYLPGNYSLRFSDAIFGCTNPTTTGETFYSGEVRAPLPIVQLNQWYDVVYTNDGTTARIYVNCVLQNSIPQTANGFTNSFDLYIGHLNNTQYPYWLNGDLDEIRIYNRAINLDEVKALASGGANETINASICQGDNYAGYTTSGTYIDTIVTAGTCNTIRTLNLTVKPKSVYTFNHSICLGDSFEGHTTSGIYSDTLVAANGCDSIRILNLDVVTTLKPVIYQSICEGQTFAGYSASGTYVDTIAGGLACDTIRTIHLTVLNAPQPELGPEKEICTYDAIVLSPGVFTNSTYVWNTGSTAPQLTVSSGGIYSVTVSNICGSATDNILIKESSCEVYIPNTFTPDNNGTNDGFKVLRGENLKDFRMSIFNRWGQKIFESTDPSKSWDGKFKKKAADQGIYVWTCTFRQRNSMTTLKGTVLLIR